MFSQHFRDISHLTSLHFIKFSATMLFHSIWRRIFLQDVRISSMSSNQSMISWRRFSWEISMVVKNFIKIQKYAVTIKNFKINKKDKKKTIYFCCTKNQKVKNSASTEQRNVFFKRVECFFLAIAKFEKNMWTLKKVIIETHNYEEDQQASHAIFRKTFMKKYDFQVDIRHQHETRETSAKILNFINIKHDSDDFDDRIIENRNISNALQIIRSNKLNNKIFIQILNVYFQSNFDKWWIRVKSDSVTKKILYMFWINKTFMNMLRINRKIMIVNCIYKWIVIDCR